MWLSTFPLVHELIHKKLLTKDRNLGAVAIFFARLELPVPLTSTFDKGKHSPSTLSVPSFIDDTLEKLFRDHT